MAARSGMAEIINQVRQHAACGTADYSVPATGGIAYWTDDQLQRYLDGVRISLWEEPIQPIPQTNAGGTAEYKEYQVGHLYLEQTTGGTSIFYLTDATGARIGTANYTIDYLTGQITFAADQHGSARYVTGRSYDVYEASARVWEAKAGHVAQRFDFSADGASFKAGQLRTSYLDMARQMRSQSNSGGMGHARMERDDVNNCDEDQPRSFRVTY